MRQRVTLHVSIVGGWVPRGSAFSHPVSLAAVTEMRWMDYIVSQGWDRGGPSLVTKRWCWHLIGWCWPGIVSCNQQRSWQEQAESISWCHGVTCHHINIRRKYSFTSFTKILNPSETIKVWYFGLDLWLFQIPDITSLCHSICPFFSKWISWLLIWLWYEN